MLQPVIVQTAHSILILQFEYVLSFDVNLDSLFREACINFMNLCKEKNEDGLWMDEIAAMQALSRPDLPYLPTSGIILAAEENGLGSIQDSGPSSEITNGSTDFNVTESSAGRPLMD